MRASASVPEQARPATPPTRRAGDPCLAWRPLLRCRRRIRPGSGRLGQGGPWGRPQFSAHPGDPGGNGRACRAIHRRCPRQCHLRRLDQRQRQGQRHRHRHHHRPCSPAPRRHGRTPISSSNWTGRNWTGRNWTGRNWTGRNWTGRSWTGRSWTGRSWTGRPRRRGRQSRQAR